MILTGRIVQFTHVALKNRLISINQWVGKGHQSVNVGPSVILDEGSKK